jgi:hypothetical protein
LQQVSISDKECHKASADIFAESMPERGIQAVRQEHLDTQDNFPESLSSYKEFNQFWTQRRQQKQPDQQASRQAVQD